MLKNESTVSKIFVILLKTERQCVVMRFLASLHISCHRHSLCLLCLYQFFKLIIICIAWIDGFAIMVAVLVVSGVGSIVDYRKEIEFVSRRNDADKSKIVSNTSSY
jgi:hypothetical protein